MANAIRPQQLAELHAQDPSVRLIDVRTPVEYREMHVEFAENMPLDRLDPRQIAESAKGNTVYVVCRSGSRGQQACQRLAAMGVEGGTLACESAGLPLVRGQKAMSLERQVRIAAGTLVFTGAVLAIVVHPYWALLAAFVGAGLVFAGVTDTCGMAMLLARMPWNQVPRGSTACRTAKAILLIATAASVAVAVEPTKDPLDTIQRRLAEKKAALIDVRELDEWNDGRLRDARFVPLSKLEKGLTAEARDELLPDDKVIYIHCASGIRSRKAAAILRDLKYDARPLKQGYEELLEAGFPAAASE
jgi:rhodanese-related sulfurtransferase